MAENQHPDDGFARVGLDDWTKHSMDGIDELIRMDSSVARVVLELPRTSVRFQGSCTSLCLRRKKAVSISNWNTSTCSGLHTSSRRSSPRGSIQDPREDTYLVFEQLYTNRDCVDVFRSLP